MQYAPLHVHSWYSLLEGVDAPEVLVRRAVECGYRALALTDSNGLYGAVPFRDAAVRAGIHPIFGATLDVGGQRCVALIVHRTGYENLCRLITAIHRSRETPERTTTLACLIPPLANGLHLLTANLRLAESLYEQLGPERLALEWVRPGPREHEWRMWRLHERLGIPIVASSNTHFATPAGYERHQLVTAIRENTLWERVAGPHGQPASAAPPTDASQGSSLPALRSSGALAHPHHALHAPAAVERWFADLPAAVEHAAWLAEQCAPDVLPHGPFIPRARVPRDQTANQHLWALCQQGIEQRYGRTAAADRAAVSAQPLGPVRERLEREMAVITGRHLADYFLVVREIVLFSRAQGLPVALRGSGGNCLTAYLIGITDVDPIAYRLPMERFLHEERQDLPDLDIDFCWRVRDRVIQYVFERFGAAHTAMISSHITLQARSAFREVAKVHGFSEAEVSRIAEQLPQPGSREGEEEERRSHIEPAMAAATALPCAPAQLSRIIAQARALVGAPHHLSVHPGGVVITPRPIDHYVPLQRAEKGVIITQFEKDAAEAIGLVKFDLLGNRSLSTVSQAMRRLPQVASSPISPYDPDTVHLVQRGDTLGVGQLESPAMRHLLVMLQPRSLYDVMQALALIRPGASSIGCKDTFIERRRGLRPIEFAHACLEPVLQDTCGLMLYEDDAMHVVAAMTGISLSEADRFRSGITKSRTDEERARWSREFLRRCEARGVPREAAKEQWVHIAKFNSYSFCKSHAASYAQLAWTGAYLKAHHPLEFWVAALNNNQGMYEKRVYIEALKRSGIRVLLPCVNRSEEEFRVEAAAIRIGLGQIRELSEKTRQRILHERGRGSYRSLGDLLSRVAIGPEESALLVRCGALDFTNRPRPELLLEATLSTCSRTSKHTRARRNHAGIPAGSDSSPVPGFPPAQLAMFDTPPFQLPALLDYSPAQRLRDEFELLRIVVGPHLMSWFRPLLARFPSRDRPTPVLCDSRQLRSLVGRSVMLAGIVAAARHTPTKNGDTMQFVTLEDEYGIFEVTLFPDICSRVPYLRLGPYRVQGYVEEQHGVVTITAKRFELVPLEKQPWGEDAQINSVRTYSPDEQSTMHRHDAPDNVRMS